MNHFCDNPLCRYKDDVPDSMRETDMLEDNKLFKLTRHKRDTTNGPAYFCGVCNNAINMAIPPVTEPQEQQLEIANEKML